MCQKWFDTGKEDGELERILHCNKPTEQKEKPIVRHQSSMQGSVKHVLVLYVLNHINGLIPTKVD